MPAKIVRYAELDDVVGIECDDHYFEFGGQEDGYCFNHQSFDCLEKLTVEQHKAIDEA